MVAVAGLAFSASGPLGKLAVPLPPVSVAAARTAIAACLLALVAPRDLVRSLAGLSAKRRLGVFVAGALLGIHLALFLAGLAATSLAAAVALVSLEPIAVVLTSFAFFGLRPTRRETLGLILATGGAVVVASGSGEGDHRLSGDLMVLASVVLYGFYVASARGLRDAMPAMPYAAAVYGASAIVLLPLAVLGWSPHGDVAPTAYLAVLGLAVIPTLIGHTLVQRAARTAPPALVALTSPGETVGSLAIGAALMGTPPTAREAVGAVLVVAGATLTVTSRG